MTNEFKAFKVSTGIIDAMVEAKLDPSEFFEFMGKYGLFIEYGLVAKKMDALGSPEYDEINKAQAMSAGIRCFGAFVADFKNEYKQKRLSTKK